MRLGEIKGNVADAHEWTLEVVGDLGHLTVFLWQVADDLEAAARGKSEVMASEVSEYSERIAYIVRLLEDRRAVLIQASEKISAASDGLLPVIEAPRPDRQAAAD